MTARRERSYDVRDPAAVRELGALRSVFKLQGVWINLGFWRCRQVGHAD
jgi:hypothetical protein